MSELSYGGLNQEILDGSIEEAVDKLIENECEIAGEEFEAIVGRMIWPIEIHEFKHFVIDPGGFSDCALERILDSLDEEYGNPDGDCTEPDAEMQDAAFVFVEAIIKNYQVWTCEPTGKIIKVSREEACEMSG